MTPTPVSPRFADRGAPPADRPADEPVNEPVAEHRVRPLPSTEPAPGARGDEPAAAWGPPPRPAPDDEVPVPARRAAHALVIMALEVVDRQRPPHQTRGAFPPHLVEMLQTLARVGVPGRDLGPARIHRVHIHAAAADGPGLPGHTDYEVCATYARGPRLFAVAARIRVTDTRAVCTALRLV